MAGSGGGGSLLARTGVAAKVLAAALGVWMSAAAAVTSCREKNEGGEAADATMERLAGLLRSRRRKRKRNGGSGRSRERGEGGEVEKRDRS